MNSLIPPVEDRIDKSVEDILARKSKFEEQLKERARYNYILYHFEL